LLSIIKFPESYNTQIARNSNYDLIELRLPGQEESITTNFNSHITNCQFLFPFNNTQPETLSISTSTSHGALSQCRSSIGASEDG
jgi:hypothetical protein